MNRVFRWLVRLLASLFIALLLGLWVIYYFASGSLPDYHRDFILSGLSDRVEIIRDNHAVPHIYGTNDEDVYFGLGFAHAQDRLWQMLLARRTAQGRLSELFGKETLAQDRFNRRLQFEQLGRKAFTAQSQQAQRILKAYAKGVNARIATIRDFSIGRGAPEHFLFNTPITPWQAYDSLTLLKYRAFYNSPHLAHEILQVKILQAVGEEYLNDLMADSPLATLDTTPQQVNFLPPQPSATQNILAFIPDSGASNIFAAAPTRTATKASLLAVDPHHTLSAPNDWMLVHLERQNNGLIGASIPGLPLIFHGRNTRLAWGLSSSHIDDIDIISETISPDDPNTYSGKNGLTAFETRDVIIKTADGTDQTITLQNSENGPVIPIKALGLEQVFPVNGRAVLRSSVFIEKDPSFSDLLALNHAKSVTHALERFSDYITPNYNLALADHNNIALQTIGKLPLRTRNYSGAGRIPATATAQNQWLTYKPYADNPKSHNPQSGLIGNTNNKIMDDAFPHHGAHIWGDNLRIRRLTKLLNERKIHSRDSFQEIQNDIVSLAARNLLPLMAKELWFKTTLSDDSMRADALELLANWDGAMEKHLAEPLIFTAWLRRFQNYVIRDELGTLAQELTRPRPIFLERVLRNINNAAKWCDIRQSIKIETCNEIALQSLNDTLHDLSNAHGNRVRAWRWGAAHETRQTHSVLGRLPIIKWFSNLHTESAGGDFTLQRAQSNTDSTTAFHSQNGAGFRALIDFSDLDNSLYILSTGQSGHPLSRHYDDLAQLWKNDEYITMSMDDEFIRASATGQTWLTPKTQNN